MGILLEPRLYNPVCQPLIARQDPGAGEHRAPRGHDEDRAQLRGREASMCVRVYTYIYIYIYIYI